MRESLIWWPYRLMPLVHYMRDCQWFGLTADCYGEVFTTSHTVPDLTTQPWRTVGPQLGEELRKREHERKTSASEGTKEAWTMVFDFGRV